MNIPPWDPQAYDREVLAERARARRLNPKSLSAKGDRASGRGLASPEDLARRRKAERRMDKPKRVPPADLSEKRRAARAQRRPTVRWPQPKQMPNGRWQARCIHKGRNYIRTFDTRAEAEQFIREIKEEG